MGLDKKFEECADGIPIRRETYTVLTRPPEPDYTVVGILLSIFGVGNFCFTLIVQIIALATVCSTPFFCPMRGSDRTNPMVAPPAKFRAAISNSAKMSPPTFASFAWPWNPTVKDTTTGYMSEWPYFQTHHGVDEENTPIWYTGETIAELNDLGNMVSLQKPAGCAVTNGIHDFVWDPFEHIVREEFLACDVNEKTFQHISTSGTVVGVKSDYKEYTSTITLYLEAYTQRKAKTVQCMEMLKKKCDQDQANIVTQEDKYCVPGCANGKCEVKTWWEGNKKKFPNNRPEPTKYKSEMAELIGQCVASLLSEISHVCECHEKAFAHYPLAHFHQGGDLAKIKVCEGGIDKNQFCVPQRVGVQLNQECTPSIEGTGNKMTTTTYNCVEKWPNSMPLYKNNKYGCFFSSPTAASELQFVYKSCNFYDADGSTYTNGGSLTRTQAQRLLNVQVSKRAALVLIFLYKECGFLSASITIILVLIALVLMFLLLSPVIYICYTLMNGKTEAGLGTRITLVKLVGIVYTLIYTYLYLIWVMVCNLSMTYRAFVMISAVVRLQVNKSLTDMDVKLTSVSGIIFLLVLIIVIDDKSSGSSPQTAAGLGSALAVQLFSLFLKMVQEKIGLGLVVRPLKDLNENRLSKFEMALLLIKIMEDFLPDDIHYNWVQHFNSQEPVMPDFDHPQYQVNALGEDHTGIFDEGHFDDLLWTCVSEDPEVRKMFYMQPLDKHLANRFGHDGQGTDFNPLYSSQTTAVHTVKVNPDNLIEFLPGEWTVGRHLKICLFSTVLWPRCHVHSWDST